MRPSDDRAVHQRELAQAGELAPVAHGVGDAHRNASRGIRHDSAPPGRPVPARGSGDPRSRYYDKELLERGIGIRFNGAERNNVE